MPEVTRYIKDQREHHKKQSFEEEFVSILKLHEIEYDGYRLLASIERGRVRLISSSGADWTARLPLIAKAVAALGVQTAILDGELVFLTSEGFPDFERLRAGRIGQLCSAKGLARGIGNGGLLSVVSAR